jgi:hypothetical protein
MDAQVSMDTGAILLFGLYVQYCCVCNTGASTVCVSAIVVMCEYVQYSVYMYMCNTCDTVDLGH